MKKIGIAALVLLLVVCIVGINRFSFENSDNELKYQSKPLEESDKDYIEYRASGFDEFNNKLSVGDTRAINQDEYDNWTNKCKELYNEWYEIGSIPSIPFIENNQLVSYEFSDNMMAISFNESEDDNNLYYEIITLKDEHCGINDIEKYYKTIMIDQNEWLELSSGTYEYIDVNGTTIKAAICCFEDSTKSVDFIWKNKYWIRMWDNSEQLELVLKNFIVKENNIRKPEDFDKKDFCKKISGSNECMYTYSSIEEFIRMKSSFDNYMEVEELNKETIIPIVKLNKYKLENVTENKSELYGDSYYQFSYLSNEDIPVEILVYSFSCIDDYIEENQQYCINLLNESNPCDYNTQLSEQYGVFEKSENDNTKMYSTDIMNLGDKEYFILFFSKPDFEYSEIAYVINNRVVKISCNKENALEELKTVASCIDIENISLQ